MTVFVRTIEGTNFWMPVDSRMVSEDEYLILEFSDFDAEDTSCLMQFVPGDVVRIKGDRAVELVSSSWKDRDYWRLLFDIASGNTLDLDVTKPPYVGPANRIANEIAQMSRSHYPTVVDWIETHCSTPRSS